MSTTGEIASANARMQRRMQGFHRHHQRSAEFNSKPNPHHTLTKHQVLELDQFNRPIRVWRPVYQA